MSIATSRFHSLSRLTKVTLSLSLGAFVWWLCTRYFSRWGQAAVLFMAMHY